MSHFMPSMKLSLRAIVKSKNHVSGLDSELRTLQGSSDVSELDAYLQSTSTSATFDTAPDLLQSVAKTSGAARPLQLATALLQAQKT